MSEIIGTVADACIIAGAVAAKGEGWYYLLSVRHSQKSDGVLTWWGPNNNGYVFRLERAGKYTEEQIAASPDYYDRGDGSRAVPCALVESLAIRVGDSKGRGCDPAVGPEDRVVPYAHIRALKKPHRKAGAS